MSDNADLAARLALAQALNSSDTGHYCERELPDGSLLAVHVQLFNVALWRYAPNIRLWWEEQW